MAARKSRHASDRHSDSIAEAGDPPQVLASTNATAPHKTRRSPVFVVAIALFLLWAACLMTLALVVESPVTLNRQQIRQADVIVRGTIDPTQTGVVLVDQSWPTDATDAAILIENLAELSLQPQQSYLLPLRHAADGTYSVVLTPQPMSVRLVYPATEDAIRSLEVVLQHEVE